MAHLTRVSVACGYAFAAWLIAGMCVHALSSLIPAAMATAARCLDLAAIFAGVFSLYFKRPSSLPPALTAALSVAFIGVVDFILIVPYFARPSAFYLSVSEWLLPASFVGASIYGAGMKR